MPHEHDLGLSHDLPTIVSRRRALGLLGGAGLALLAACSGREASRAAGGGARPLIPEEARGPFPGDTPGADVLAESGVVRSDITGSFGTASAVADGVPLTLRLRVLDVSGGAGGAEGAAVYVWHCDRQGRYSLYESPVEDENYLRGVQVADADGRVEFRTVFPGTYEGRWPHVHLEVYRDVDAATGGGSPLRTSQLAFPQDACERVYATAGYEDSVGRLAALSLETDGVFADGYSRQLAAMSGAPADGLVAALDVPV